MKASNPTDLFVCFYLFVWKVLSENPLPLVPVKGTSSTGHTSKDNDIYEDVCIPDWALKWEIKWKNLIIEDKILGKGNFGEVRLGGVKVRGQVTKAAIKMLKGKSNKIV